jgi:hypothetical protein
MQMSVFIHHQEPVVPAAPARGLAGWLSSLNGAGLFCLQSIVLTRQLGQQQDRLAALKLGLLDAGSELDQLLGDGAGDQRVNIASIFVGQVLVGPEEASPGIFALLKGIFWLRSSTVDSFS